MDHMVILLFFINLINYVNHILLSYNTLLKMKKYMYRKKKEEKNQHTQTTKITIPYKNYKIQFKKQKDIRKRTKENKKKKKKLKKKKN